MNEDVKNKLKELTTDNKVQIETLITRVYIALAIEIAGFAILAYVNWQICLGMLLLTWGRNMSRAVVIEKLSIEMKTLIADLFTKK